MYTEIQHTSGHRVVCIHGQIGSIEAENGNTIIRSLYRSAASGKQRKLSAKLRSKIRDNFQKSSSQTTTYLYTYIYTPVASYIEIFENNLENENHRNNK
jgi:hypothetical protein